MEATAPCATSPWFYRAWDLPTIEKCAAHIVVKHAGVVLADTTRSLKVVESTLPPAYYVPPTDVAMQHLRPGRKRTQCGFKGEAHHYDVKIEDKIGHNVAWTYPMPDLSYARLAGYVAFYPHMIDECWIDGMRVDPRVGRPYGGWAVAE